MFQETRYNRLVVGYHGTDQYVVDDVLRGGPLTISENPHDWLGTGVYFWEYGPKRALEWAIAYSRMRPDRIKRPAVLGAYIHLGRCFDLMDTTHTNLLRDMFPAFRDFNLSEGKTMPVNKAPKGKESEDLPIRNSDCAVINWTLDQLEKSGDRYDTVRSAFVERPEIFPNSMLMLKSHIQIAVRPNSPHSILGYFIPELTGAKFERRIHP